MLYLPGMEAIKFEPLYMERIWGGRKLETIYGRKLPDLSAAFGEAWEIVDRENEQSVVTGGAFSGKSLHELWIHHREEIFGTNLPDSERFPILIKILDSADDLSIQVHPSAKIAAGLNGEPKTEMWFIAGCELGSKLYVGLKNGVTRNTFEKAIQDGTVADQIHTITPQKGQSIFIESGRLHAIGAGFLIHEIQQNSDTTYRVFDWNRTDRNGNHRELHVEQSMQCIDFRDTEPQMDEVDGETLATCPHFKITQHQLVTGELIANPSPDQFSLITVVSGCLDHKFNAGETILLPKSATPLTASEETQVLQITIPHS